MYYVQVRGLNDFRGHFSPRTHWFRPQGQGGAGQFQRRAAARRPGGWVHSRGQPVGSDKVQSGKYCEPKGVKDFFEQLSASWSKVRSWFRKFCFSKNLVPVAGRFSDLIR